MRWERIGVTFFTIVALVTMVAVLINSGWVEERHVIGGLCGMLGYSWVQLYYRT